MRGQLWRDPCVLGIDLGTSSTKAVLLDATGAELNSASVPVQLSRPRPVGGVGPGGLVVVREDRCRRFSRSPS